MRLPLLLVCFIIMSFTDIAYLHGQVYVEATNEMAFYEITNFKESGSLSQKTYSLDFRRTRTDPLHRRSKLD